MLRIGCDGFYADFSTEGRRLSITGGRMADFTVVPSPLFSGQLRHTADEVTAEISSEDLWDSVTYRTYGDSTEITCAGHEKARELTVICRARIERGGLVWQMNVINDSPDWIVMYISYPMPVLEHPRFTLFMPFIGGKTVEDAGNTSVEFNENYPSGRMTMQYFAVYSKESGVYLGLEDGRAAVKRFAAKACSNRFELTPSFFGINGGIPGNSFVLYGEARWQPFTGDWYDASMIYADFVRSKAEWLPEAGRPDTPERFRRNPFWICDYIPNTPSQRDNRPMSLSAGSDIYEADYWYKAPIQLQKELGVPIAYHVYNWHEIPFNIEYPHFLPAKETFLAHAGELRDNSIYVLPYINAVSWEKHDGEMGHDVNYDNSGAQGAVILKDNSVLHQDYPQTTEKGETSYLVQMCPAYSEWHRIMEKLTRDIERSLPVDGIYYDQTGAVTAQACYNSEHSHLPGGGSWWVEGWNAMMARIRAKKPDDSFYFTEDNAEPYMKSFDGYLTWTWVYPGEVPAFSAVYAGYVQLLGRCTIGKKKEDLPFFRYFTARSLVSGHQLGWCKADLVWKPRWLSFLKNAVRVRWELSDVFNAAQILRPPEVKTPLPKLITTPGLWFDGKLESEQIISGAWRFRDKDKTVIIAVNISDETVPFTLTFDISEYGIQDKQLPECFRLDGNRCTVSDTLETDGIRVYTIT